MRPISGIGTVLALSFGCAAAAHAQGVPYPVKPIHFIIPQTAGGQIDTVGRTMAQNLGERLGQPWIVENRAGANGAIGYEAVARSAPDGYTLVMSSQSGLVFAPVLKKALPYDPVADFTSVTPIFDTPYYLVVHPSLPVRSVQEFLALAKAQPGKLNYATTGVGSGQHLFMEMFRLATGINIVHVPYKGSSQAGADLLAGNVQAMLQFYGFTVPNAKAGKTRALATTAAQRTAAMPDLPTMAEAGVPGYVAATWYAMSGPARLPRTVVDRLNREAGEVMRLPAVKGRFDPMDVVLTPGAPEVLTERIKKEIPQFVAIARQVGIEPE